MQLELDHVVHAVVDPEAVKDAFAAKFGWHAVPGGRHADWGTYNTLCYFDLSYLEWVGVFDAALAKSNEFGRWVQADLERSEGLVQFSLRTTDMDTVVRSWQRNSLPFVGPIEGSRTRPDGSVLRWRLLFPARSRLEDFPLPFLIEWSEPDEFRREDLIRRGMLPASGEANVRIAGLHAVVRDLEGAMVRWDAYYGEWTATAANGRTVRCGDVDVYFWAPETPFLQGMLANRGERAFQVDLVQRGRVGAGHPALKGFIPGEPVHGLHVRCE